LRTHPDEYLSLGHGVTMTYRVVDGPGSTDEHKTHEDVYALRHRSILELREKNMKRLHVEGTSRPASADRDKQMAALAAAAEAVEHNMSEYDKVKSRAFTPDPRSRAGTAHAGASRSSSREHGSPGHPMRSRGGSPDKHPRSRPTSRPTSPLRSASAGGGPGGSTTAPHTPARFSPTRGADETKGAASFFATGAATVPPSPAAATQAALDRWVAFTLVVVPDVFSSLDALETQLRPLLAKFPMARLVLVGLPGLPNTAWPPHWVLNPDLHARAVAKLMQHLHSTGRCVRLSLAPI